MVSDVDLVATNEDTEDTEDAEDVEVVDTVVDTVVVVPLPIAEPAPVQ